MKTIETVITIGPDNKLILQLPPDITPGEHRVVVVIDELPTEKADQRFSEFPVIDVGPWPGNISLRREKLYDDWGR